jgi:hypothetical protein
MKNISNGLRPHKSIVVKRIIYFCSLFFTLTIIGSCDWFVPQNEKAFRYNVRQLEKLLDGYEKVPNNKINWKKNPHETKAIYVGTNFGKNKSELKAFYKETALQWEKVDVGFLELIDEKESSEWKFDAIFCRAFMYTIWAKVDNNISRIEKTISVLDDYIAFIPSHKIHKWTKNAMGKSFWEKYGRIFNPNFSDELNISLLFRLEKSALLMLIGNYKMAKEQYEYVAKNAQGTNFDAIAKGQIEVCEDLIKGKAIKDK